MVLTAQGKNIPTYPIGNLFIQGERYADTIYIVVDRFHNGWDLSECSFTIKGETESGEIASAVLLFETLEDKLRIEWRVSGLFTRRAGKLQLELTASVVRDDITLCIVRYDMSPVNVKPSLTGTNEIIPDTAEQTISQINQAAAEGLSQIRAEIEGFDIDSVSRRLDVMEDACMTFLARPEIIAVTQREYNSSEHKENSLYIIIEEE